MPPLNCLQNLLEAKGFGAQVLLQLRRQQVNRSWLFFTAGPGDEEHGLFGYIKR
jgi:hypothetical protein